MFATVRRFFQKRASGSQPERLESRDDVQAAVEAETQSPKRPRLLGPRFTEPPSPESEGRSRSRSRSPALGVRSPPLSPTGAGRPSFPRGRRSSIATRKRLSFSKSPPIQRRRSMAASRRSVAAKSRRSFPHRDFANPEAETCWLSCLFQALWHSVVFHSAFEQDLAPEHYTPACSEALLTALQETWIEYKAENKSDVQPDTVQAGCGGADDLVPTDGLVGGFGEGYGDMSEALACLQSELSDSTNLAAVALSERIVMLPLTIMDEDLPGPDMAWKLAQEWQVCKASLIAVDINVPELSREDMSSLARLWVFGHSEAKEEQTQILGDAGQIPRNDFGKDEACMPQGLSSSHQIVALVCYMWHLQHYVAFCRRQSNSLRCCFFNDLPELTTGVPKEVEWKRVPDVCAEFSLMPRLVLYESADVVGAQGV